MMPDTMQALLVTELGKVILAERPVPRIDDASILVKVHFSGVSVGTEMLQGTGKLPKPLPFIPGYQAAGEVVSVGAGVKGFAVGEAVAFFCRAGSHARYASTTPELVHRLRGLDAAQLASLFVQPSVGANALNLASVGTGDTVLVVGQGLIGQMTAQLARLRGAFVAASDVVPSRLALARAHCADWVLDARDGTIAEQVAQRFAQGFDVVIETSGAAAVIEDALRCATYGGRFAFVAYHPGALPLPFDIAHRRELRTFFPFFIGKPPVRDGVLRLLESGVLALEPLISHAVPFTRAAELYQSLFTSARSDVNGMTIDWRAA
ncbi:MAG: zinc-binding dehydrogenase [Alphaproteobacteria bacterium]|nr:zinc-binding dehydrogenase [Alphaproteobacteria bacterium]